MRRSGAAVVWLTIFWVALWEHLTPANVLGGLVVAVVAVWLVPGRVSEHPLTVRPWPALRLAAYFTRQLFTASAIVAWEVVTPRNRIHEGIVAVPLPSRSEFVATFVANAVTLTPGTLSLEVAGDPPVLYVHVLHLKEVEDVRRDVIRLEELVRDAFVSDVEVHEHLLPDQPGTGT
jgi:multicomponent Na+:H+ antiporter subunit E